MSDGQPPEHGHAELAQAITENIDDRPRRVWLLFADELTESNTSDSGEASPVDELGQGAVGMTEPLTDVLY